MRIIYTLMLLLSSVMSQSAFAAPDAQDVMKKNFFASKVSAFNGKASMTLINSKDQQRQRKISIWSKLKGNGDIDAEVLIRFDAPADIKGTGFLQIENSVSNADDDIWVFLPALSKTRRMVASNKRDSFFGTDFSYGDILPPPVEQYSHNYLRDESIRGVNCYVIESTPKEEKTKNDSGYSRKISWIDPANFMERQVEYYDVSGKLLKTQHTYELKEIEPSKKRWVATHREMVNHQTNHKTIYLFEQLALDPQLQDSFFSTRTLEK